MSARSIAVMLAIHYLEFIASIISQVLVLEQAISSIMMLFITVQECVFDGSTQLIRLDAAVSKMCYIFFVWFMFGICYCMSISGLYLVPFH